MGQKVDILLSTYNGKKYVNELIGSVMKQDYRCFNLLIRDDNSTDGTNSILAYWKQRYPDQIRIIEDLKGNLGVTGSMFELVKESTAPYMIFCDQDDVWFPKKVRTLLRAIQYKEREYPNIPLIVHCEAYTTDEKLNFLNKTKKTSLHAYQSGRNKKQTSFANLLLCNPVQGASMIFNQKLKEELIPLLNVKVPKTLIYDSVVSSVCSIRGKVLFLNRPLMYYRQHSNNVVGAKKMYLRKLNSYSQKDQEEVKTANFLFVNRMKCDLIKRYYWNILDNQEKKILSHYRNTPNDWNEFFKLGLNQEFSMKQIMIMMFWQIS